MMETYPHQFTIEWDEELHHLTLSFVTLADLEKFVYPDGIEMLTVCSGSLDHLHVPCGVQSVYVSGIGLRTIFIPDSVTVLRCDNNCLRWLELPAGIEDVDASNNFLALLSFRAPPKRLTILNISNNLFVSLDIDTPATLRELDISFNMFLRDEAVSEKTLKDMVFDSTERGAKRVYIRC